MSSLLSGNGSENFSIRNCTKETERIAPTDLYKSANDKMYPRLNNMNHQGKNKTVKHNEYKETNSTSSI
jgi:hypothetical protein